MTNTQCHISCFNDGILTGMPHVFFEAKIHKKQQTNIYKFFKKEPEFG